MKQKCYISGPITGVPDYAKDFAFYENKIKSEKGWDVINPAKIGDEMPAENTSYSEYMDLCLTLLKQCDCIFLIPGWQDSRGARFEKEYAAICEKDIYILDKNQLLQLQPEEQLFEAEWIRDQFATYCSACGGYAFDDSDWGYQESDYCPNCGAKMKD